MAKQLLMPGTMRRLAAKRQFALMLLGALFVVLPCGSGWVGSKANSKHFEVTKVARTPKTTRRVWDTAWMSDPWVSTIGWSALVSGLTILRVATMNDETHTPRKFLEGVSGKDALAQTGPVVCLGDSITRGNLSADWVSVLRQQLTEGVSSPSTPVLNAGVNMQCSQNVQQRLEEVIACRPSHVTVLVGTNDLKAELNPVEGLMYRVFGQLPEVPSLDSYESTLREITERLLAAGARVALVSPPVLGEDISSYANSRAAAFADAVKRVAAGSGERCTYLPLFESTYDALPRGGRPYDGLKFFAWVCLLCWDLHVLGRDLRDVQRERQLGVTVDLVHLGPEAAKNLAEMVADFVRQPRLAST